jgi:hypothetical protein
MNKVSKLKWIKNHRRVTEVRLVCLGRDLRKNEVQKQDGSQEW